MYSRGTDFSTATGSAAANGTLTQITQQLGSLDPSNGTGVVYFSTITYAGNSYCYDAGNPTYGTKSGTTYSRTGPAQTTDALCSPSNTRKAIRR